MKYLPLNKLTILLFSTSLLFLSCKKEHGIHKKPFKIQTSTFYRLSPTNPVPLVINGVNYAGFAYFPGAGSGNASHIGNCKTFFNQLTYGSSPEAPPAGSIAAPLVDISNYPIIGAPLPLIQAGDFTSLPSVISSLNIPASVYGKIINQVVYNNKGDAIFMAAIDGSGGTFPLSATKVGFNGKALITKGSGKFEHAVGEVDYSGYFNIADANDAEYNAEGWIDY